ncbi:hypothetical protein HN587_01415 [Candidatus Woesearchaeota archaeon]|jgi:preprotein translocase subunit SecD|nr:hypothetical protein [Candidatus Woesearchaeota archaeon]
MVVKEKAKDIIKNLRVIVLVIAVILSLVAIHPDLFGRDGVAIRSVQPNSTASWSGIQSPSPKTTPMARELVLALNNIPIHEEKDYYDFIKTLEPNKTVQIQTDKGFYNLIVESDYMFENTNQTELKIVNETIQEEIELLNVSDIPSEYYDMNGTLMGDIKTNDSGAVLLINKTIEVEKEFPIVIKHLIGAKDIGLNIQDAPTTNIRKGLDLSGGTRVLLQPERKITSEEMSLILANLKERINVFGLTDVVIRETKDLPPPLGQGNQYISVEIAGVKQEEIKDLLSKQGKFEAKVGNKTVFQGGKDITYVCRTAECSGIDPQRGCGKIGSSADSEWACAFRFSIALSPAAAQKQADATANLDVVSGDGDANNQYLSEQLNLMLDDSLVDSLNIGVSLKGKAATDIQISGSGAGATQQEAVISALANMKRLQTIMITGSLPIKLNIVKTDELSPVLGKEFVSNALLIGLLSILVVSLVVFIRYREIKVALPMLVTMISEVIMLLGIASLIQWNLDLAAIAGIIVAVGTGVDDQIVITDETLRGEGRFSNWKEKIKRAFFIIMGAYFTTVVAMLPLLFAGAGIIKGFALTTIIGVSVGVFISRPAYAAIVEILLRK